MAKSVMGGIFDVLSGRKSAWEAEEEIAESKNAEEQEKGSMGLLARLEMCAENITNMDFDNMRESSVDYGRSGGRA